MRVFYATTDIPSAGHRAPGAVSVVTYEAASALRDAGHAVVIQPFLLAAPTETQSADLAALRAQGFALGEPLLVPPTPARRAGLIREAAAGAVADYFPSAALAEEIRRRADGSDLVLHVWSPEALAACSRVDAPVFAYYGNPDHKPIAARLAHPELFDPLGRGLLRRTRRALRRASNRRRERANVDLMRTCRWAGNVCAIDAEFYAGAGHPRSFYVRNMWSRNRPGRPADDPVIVGSIGNLGATGNTFGLWYLGTEIVPALVERLGDRFTVDICGGGTPVPPVARALEHPRVRALGWVEDIDEKIRSSPVFLIANNNHPDFRVGHTRLLHAWSLGACVVAHRGMALAMPEIVHGENALLGDTGEEIADQVAVALGDVDVRERIAAGGLATFERAFTPQVVVESVLAHVAE